MSGERSEILIGVLLALAIGLVLLLGSVCSGADWPATWPKLVSWPATETPPTAASLTHAADAPGGGLAWPSTSTPAAAKQQCRNGKCPAASSSSRGTARGSHKPARRASASVLSARPGRRLFKRLRD